MNLYPGEGRSEMAPIRDGIVPLVAAADFEIEADQLHPLEEVSKFQFEGDVVSTNPLGHEGLGGGVWIRHDMIALHYDGTTWSHDYPHARPRDGCRE